MNSTTPQTLLQRIITSSKDRFEQIFTGRNVETIDPRDEHSHQATVSHTKNTIDAMAKHWRQSPDTVDELILRSLKNARGNITSYETLVDAAAQLIYPRADQITQKLYHQAQHDPDAATFCARVCVHAAYRARGENYLDFTSTDQIQSFTHYLTCGNEFLDIYPGDIRQCPTTITTILAHMAGMNHNDDMAYALYDDARTTAVDFWPATFWLIQSRRSVWSGDLMQLLGLAEDVLTESARGGPQSIAAALASRYLDDPQGLAEQARSAKAKPMVLEQLWSTSHNVLAAWQNFPDPHWSTIHQIFAAETYRNGFPNLAQAHLRNTTAHLNHYALSVVTVQDFHNMLKDLDMRHAPNIGRQHTPSDDAKTPNTMG